MAIRYLDEPTTAQPQAAQPAGRIRYLDDTEAADFEQFKQPDPIRRTPEAPMEEGTPTTSSPSLQPLEAQESPRPTLTERAKLGARVGFAESGMGLLARTPIGQTLKDLPAGLGVGTDVTGGLFRLFDVPTNAQETVALRQEFENMPNAKNAAELAATGFGVIGGGSMSPETFVPIGRGATLARSIARTGAVTGGLNALVDIGRQELDIAQGIKEEFSLGELALNAGVGAIAGGLVHLSLEGLGRLSQRIREALAGGRLTPAQAAELAKLEQAAQLAAQRKAQAVEGDVTQTRFDEDPAATAALLDIDQRTSSIPLDEAGRRVTGGEPTGIRLPDILTAEEAAAQGLPFQRGAVTRTPADEAALAAGRTAEDATIRADTENAIQELVNEWSQLTGRPYEGLVNRRRGKTDLEFMQYLREQIGKAKARPTTQATTEVTTQGAAEAAPAPKAAEAAAPAKPAADVAPDPFAPKTEGERLARARPSEPSKFGVKSYGDTTSARVERPPSTPEEDVVAYKQLDDTFDALPNKEKRAFYDSTAMLREDLKNRHFNGDTPTDSLLSERYPKPKEEPPQAASPASPTGRVSYDQWLKDVTADNVDNLPRPYTKSMAELKAVDKKVAELKAKGKKGGGLRDLDSTGRPKDQTQTPEFKRWFAESKVVDDAGNPLVVYHGTQADIPTSFDTAGGAKTTGNVTAVWGSFFTPSPGEASRYATEPFSGRSGISGARVLPVYLKIKNPYVMSRAEWDKHAMKVFRGMKEDVALAEERAFKKQLQDEGYDGVVIGGRGFNKEFVAFEPTQIKSAIGNRGKFDPRNPDISGRINITPGATTLGGALVGGAGGAGYGITQGDTPEERIQNAIKYGVAWAGIGAAAGLGSGKLAQARRLTHSQKVIRAAQELERMRTGAGSVDVPQRGASDKALKQIQAKALGTDGMPNWWIKMRSTPVMQTIREGIRNRSSRAKDVLVKTVKAGEKVTDEENFYVAQRLFPGRARAQKEATDTLFKESEKAFKDAAKEAGIDPNVTAEQYADYMRAKHAPAYNRYVGEPGDTAPASGMTDAQAAAKIQGYRESGLDKFFEDFAATDRNIVEATRKILEGDVITPEHASWLRKNAPDYVPLNRDIDLEDAVFNVGGTRGFTVKGSGIRKAVGSELPYADMRGNLQANLTDAIIRVEKNRVAQRVYKFFEKHPWPGVSLERPKVIGKRKIAGGHEIPLYGEVPEGTMVARFGGKPHYVRFRDPKMANAFGDFGMDRVGSVLRWIGTLTRAFSGLVTRLNPNFWMPNLIRDRFDAFSQHASMNDWRGAFAQISPVTRGGVGENMRGVMDNFLNIESQDAKLYRQMIDDGGTSGGYGLSSRQDILERITKMREQLNKGVLGRTDWLKFVDVINELSENSTRLGAYRRALQVGATREQAALAARDISIDFDMKGTLTKELASLWAFLNPATQGPVNFLKAQIRNPKTAVGILSGIAAVSAALNKINNSIDEDWKQKPQFKHSRENGFVMLYGKDPVTGDIQHFTIPIAQSMRPFKAMIDLGLDVSSGEIEDVRQGMRDAAMVLFNENPTGASRPGLSQITPTLGRPFVDIAENRDYADRPLYPDFFRGKPEIANKARMYASTPDTPIGKAAIQMSAIADAAFDMDVSPEHVQYIVESYLGGPGRTATQAVNLAGALAKGEAPAPRDIPIVSSFVREARGETSERATKEYKDAYKAFSEAATQDALVRGRALNMFNKVRDLPREQWVPTLIQQLQAGDGDRLEDGTINPNFARSLANIVENEMKGRTATDEVILKMGVGSGARANYFFGEINKLPPEQRAAYIVEQKRKGLITPDVEKQLIRLFSQQRK